jgi:hypothetical protein
MEHCEECVRNEAARLATLTFNDGITSSSDEITNLPRLYLKCERSNFKAMAFYRQLGNLRITDTLFSNYHWWLYTNLGADTLLCHLGYRVLREYEDSDRVLLFRVLSIPPPPPAAAAAAAA